MIMGQLEHVVCGTTWSSGQWYWVWIKYGTAAQLTALHAGGMDVIGMSYEGIQNCGIVKYQEEDVLRRARMRHGTCMMGAGQIERMGQRLMCNQAQTDEFVD